MAELLQGWKRTHRCAELGAGQVGQEVLLMGWAGSWRDLGALVFIGLRDRSGVMQVTFEQGSVDAETFERASSIRSEYVIAVKGVLQRRAADMVNKNMPTGEFEVLAKELKILSRAETTPIYIEDELDTQEQVRLKYRYLDLRRPRMQSILMTRAKVTNIARSYFAENGFIEVETPVLCKSSPEGARDYLVPSRVHPGEFYALPQSPQLFKQLLMVAGMDRYIQIAKCFRDEDLRADRQPEFTQIDLEMSFVDMEDVMAVNEGFMQRLLKEVLGVEVRLPLPRLSWIEAMERFGSDKPDTRFGLEICNVSEAVRSCGFSVFASAVEAGGSVRCINAKGAVEKLTRKQIDELSEFVKTYRAKGLAWMSLKPDGMQCSFAKFLTEGQLQEIKRLAGAETGDIIFFVADASNEEVFQSLGALRLNLGKRLALIDEGRIDLLWVTEFPLLEYDEEEQRCVAKHHPFTSPMDEDLHLLDTEPLKARAKAYDMVLNGVEIGGGSIRIHSAEIQQKMFDVIGLSREAASERFGYLMEAFKYGAPPHGGLAYGLDRLIMLLAGTNNIRDVIAFPKVQNASCLMTEAPSPVEPRQLEELHISTHE